MPGFLHPSSSVSRHNPYAVISVPPPHPGGRRLCRQQLSMLWQVLGKGESSYHPAGPCLQICILAQLPRVGRRAAARGCPPKQHPWQCRQHVGSLRAPGTARLLIGADRAEGRKKGEGRHRKSKVMVLPGTSPWVPRASLDGAGIARRAASQKLNLVPLKT